MASKAKITLRKFFDEVYRPRRLLGGSPLTAKNYHGTIRHFARHLGREPKISDLNEAALSAFLTAHDNGKRASYTVWSAQKHLMALAAYAQRKGLIREVPEVRPIVILTEPPTSYTPEEIGRLIEQARLMRGKVDGIPSRLYWPALLQTVYYTGLRHGTLFKLRLRDLDVATGTIHAPAAMMKNRRAQSLRIPEVCLAAILAMGQPERELLFPWDKTPDMRHYYMKKLLKAAGLPHGRRDQLQRIRRTTATLMHRAHADATTQLGHSSDAITRRHYLDTSADVQAADVLPRPGGAVEAVPAAVYPALSFSVCVGV